MSFGDGQHFPTYVGGGDLWGEPDYLATPWPWRRIWLANFRVFFGAQP
jgi:hypothetical protein